ncbi:hypothetical protein SFRURICE_019887 [Spodoptera frugiperda]|nr:hypothetical protein SFRURICE_019887 [Spodoptera frugiperda]
MKTATLCLVVAAVFVYVSAKPQQPPAAPAGQQAAGQAAGQSAGQAAGQAATQAGQTAGAANPSSNPQNSNIIADAMKEGKTIVDFFTQRFIPGFQG